MDEQEIRAVINFHAAQLVSGSNPRMTEFAGMLSRQDILSLLERIKDFAEQLPAKQEAA